MPLLICPNCQSNMQALNRADVEFDMCPTCRGVWLDRGELEKIIQSGRDSEPATPAPAPAYVQRPPAHDRYREHGEQGENGERGDHERASANGRHRRKRGFDLFDIFD
ncbi:zf-TFIIB domain-containing protein [Terricaulis sp.]|uniref:TFIIB-type zinc ribbon-containing protein n=1 Tax=Terricaulis sp. TaxID=2768686 RepID=UPI002AC71286|nr:zf-TFIIB domain-containing protein [Terricaulis sp.]MDZ4692787.1 zf-TFIIB domain-containing protein [Terricaulis sp.]